MLKLNIIASATPETYRKLIGDIPLLENFEKNSKIDGITIVCVKDWIPHLKEILVEYKISKAESMTIFL